MAPVIRRLMAFFNASPKVMAHATSATDLEDEYRSTGAPVGLKASQLQSSSLPKSNEDPSDRMSSTQKPPGTSTDALRLESIPEDEIGKYSSPDDMSNALAVSLQNIVDDKNVNEAPQTNRFPWFRLSRELRNKIYVLVAEETPFDKRHGHQVGAARSDQVRLLHLSPRPATALQLVSKQFRREYMEEICFTAQTIEYRPTAADRLDIESLKSLLHANHIRKLVVSINQRSNCTSPTRPQIAKMDESVLSIKSELTALLPLLPRLEHVVFHLRIRLDLGEHNHRVPIRVRSGASLAAVFLPEAQASLSVDTEVALRSELYTPYQVPGWKPSMAHMQTNWIEYRGVTSEDPNAWCGLDLEVISCGMLLEQDLEEANARAAAEVAARALEAHRRVREAHHWRCSLHAGRNDEVTEELEAIAAHEEARAAHLSAKIFHLQRCLMYARKSLASSVKEDSY